MKVLLDINVIIDSLRARAPFNIESDQILIDGSLRKFDCFITASSIINIHYLIHKELHNEKQTRKAINSLLYGLKVLDTSALDCLNALESKIKDYEDGVLEQTAFNHQIDIIVTRNKKDFKNSRVPAITPKEFIETFYREGVFV